MVEPQAYLNGRFIPVSRAMVPVGDAGFVLGAAVAEQVRTFGGKLFRLADHLARLTHSLQIVGVDPQITTDQLAGIAEDLVARNHRLLAPDDDLGLAIVVTPGAYPAYPPPEPTGLLGPSGPLVCLHTYPLPFRLWVEKYAVGQSLVTTDVEQVSDRCWPPTLKCRSRMHYYLADRQAAAIEAGARALLLDRDGLVAETSTANIVIFKSGRGLISPPSEKILHGISQAVAVELAGRLGIAVSEADLTPQDVSSADEVLLLSTPLCLLPVTRFNGRPIGSGKPGDVFRRLAAAWSEFVQVDIVGQAERFAARHD